MRAKQLTAGYDDLRQEDGDLERPLSGDEWFTPGESLSCDGTTLVVDSGRLSESLRPVKAAPQMLEGFANLAKSGDAEHVLAYAKRWGMLELCHHHLPQDHGQMQIPMALATAGDIAVTFSVPDDCRWLAGREPLEVWRYYAKQAYALLGVFSRLQESKPALAGDWEALGEFGPWTLFDDDDAEGRGLAELVISRLVGGDESMRRQRLAAAGAIETWLQLVRVRLELRWGQARPTIGFATGSLFGALGVQLLLAAANSKGFVMCPECGTVHTPPRERHRPPKYCQTCRQARVPQKRASQAFTSRHADPPKP